MPDLVNRHWIGVAARAHVLAGVAGGFCQLGHGKAAPLLRLRPDDWLAYYAPTEEPGGGPVQAFVAIGRVAPGEPWPVTMGAGRAGHRRAVAWLPAKPAPIRPLLGRLSFIPDPARWGYPFRRGSFAVSEADFRTIATAMGVELQE